MQRRGFTLIQLLIALTIAGTLSFLAAPGIGELIRRTETTSRVNAIIGLVRFARQTAVTQRRWITLCPARGDTCTSSREWQSGIMAFADINRDGERQPVEPIVAYQSALDAGERLTWRSFRRKNFLQFRSAGYTNFQNGSFHYCPADGDARYGKVVIVNIQGRAVPSVDLDGDGIDEQANGTPLRC